MKSKQNYSLLIVNVLLPVQAALTKYHRLEGVTIDIYFFPGSGDWEVQDRGPRRFNA